MAVPNTGFQVSWFVLTFLTYLNDLNFSSAESGVLLNKKESDAGWQWTVYKLGAGSGWSRQSSPGRYAVCDIPSTQTNHTNSWLISDFIQTKGVAEVVGSLTFTARQCPNSYPFCVQYFNLFAFFTDTEITGGILMNHTAEGKLSFIANVTASMTWNSSVTPRDNKVNVTFLVPKKGFYLAFRDIGACISLVEVTVTYKYCPPVTINGVKYNRTFSPALRDSEKNITGRCLDNASAYPRSALLVGKCQASGGWKIDQGVRCLCNPGFEMHNEQCRSCPSGTFKISHGNQVCSLCASHTHPAMSRDRCDCDEGYYRAVDDSKNSSCTVPPSSPRNVRATLKAQAVAIVIWLPPVSTGGRDDVTYDVICKQCINGICNTLCNDVSFWPANQSLSWTHVTITGVESRLSYRITILAKNGVSDVAGVKYHSNASVVISIPDYTANAEAAAKSAENSKQVDIAIAVSVICTFLFCLVVGIILAVFFIQRKKNRVMSSAFDKSNGYKRQRNTSRATEDTESQSIGKDSNSLSSNLDVGNNVFGTTNEDEKTAVPKIRLERITTPDGRIANSWCHERTGQLGQKSATTEGLANQNMGSCVSVKSWFPQEDVQYGI